MLNFDLMWNRGLVLLLLPLLISCQEEQDELPPEIDFLSPTEQSRYGVLESVPIEARIRDNEQIESISLRLIRSADRRQVLGSKTYQASGKNFSLSDFFVLNDSLLEAGEYYFDLSVSDGENEIAAFKTIRISAMPKRRLGVLVHTETASGSVLYQLTDQGQNTLLSLSEQPLEVAFNAYDQHYWVLPQNSNELKAYNLKEQRQVVGFSATSSFSNPFQDAYLHDRQLFYTFSGGAVQRFSASLSNRSLLQTNPQIRLGQVAAAETYMLHEESQINGSNRQLKITFSSSGGNYGTLNLQHPLVDIAFYQKDKALIVEQAGNNIQLSLCDAANISKRNLSSLNGQQGKKIVVQDERFSFIVTNRAVYRFDAQLEQVLLFLNLANVNTACLDPLNDHLLVAVGNNLREYRLSDGQLVSQHSFAETIDQLSIWFNR